ncbi:MAG: cytochrome P450 [Janthinobacterium lividum]
MQTPTSATSTAAMARAVDSADAPAHVPRDVIVDFDVYHPPGLADDFHLAWKNLQGQGLPPLVWTTRNGGHWIPTRGEDVATLLSDHERLSSRVMSVPKERVIGNSPIPGSMDPPAQIPFHMLVVAAFAPKAVRNLEESVLALTTSLIDGLIDQHGCEFVSEFAIQLPLRIFMGYAALPLADLPKLRALAEEKVRPTGRIPVAEVMRQLAEYLEPYISARTAAPGDDLISQLVTGTITGRPMLHDEAIRLCSQVLVAGLDTVASILSFTMLYLARHADIRRRIAAQPERIPAVVEEFIRRFPLVAIGREVRSDFEFGGVTLRSGDLIVLPTMLYGLDDALFTEPMTVDVERKPSTNLTFGQGPHRCPGAPLARLEMRIVLREWLRRIPDFSVADGAVPGYKSGVVGTMSNLPLRW